MDIYLYICMYSCIFAVALEAPQYGDALRCSVPRIAWPSVCCGLLPRILSMARGGKTKNTLVVK